MKAAVHANCRTATGLIRMFRSWFSHSLIISHRPSVSAIRTPAVMSAPYATQGPWISHPVKQPTPPYESYNNHIIRSEQDERDYRLIRLQNGLQAMLIHDLKADKAAASLDVAVGHLYDPVCCAWTF